MLQRRSLLLALSVPFLFGLLLIPACSNDKDESPRPNVLFIVWDTTRADRMSVYGYERETTPYLEQWAQQAHVFEDCTSTGSSTVPSHAGMFTGLLPSEHGANNLHQYLDSGHLTLAELFKFNGYRTYLFAANPHIGAAENFQQGFDVEEHPWSEKYIKRAYEIVRNKLPLMDRSSELTAKIHGKRFQNWDIKAAGELAQEGLLDWLERSNDEKPFFAFLNYMEAHRPFVPPEKFRERFMTPDQVVRSYETDRSWDTMWSYTFGLHEYSADDLEVMARTYDACIAELDDLHRRLIQALEEKGMLDNTIVILTGDHGEHLGEHHMLDHQYSLYEGLIRVPMILHYPAKLQGKRISEPVQNFDVFPTLVDLAALQSPAKLPERAVSLLSAKADRSRLSEYPSDFVGPIKRIRKLNPGWDPKPFERRLTAFYQGGMKLIWASDGRHELYDLRQDPDEKRNLLDEDNASAAEMQRKLASFLQNLDLYDYDAAQEPELSEEQRAQHEALLAEVGYVGDEGEDEGEE